MSQKQVKTAPTKHAPVIEAVVKLNLPHILLIYDPKEGLSANMDGGVVEMVNMLGNVALQNPDFFNVMREAVRVTTIKLESKGQSRPERKKQK